MHNAEGKMSGRARCILHFAFCICVLACTVRPARAQEAPPRIGPFVVDLHGVVPKFGDDPQLGASRGLSQAELPGPGLGLSAAVHVYLPKIAGITVGLGGEAIIARSGASPPDASAGTTSSLRAVTETFKEISPQLSLNFGHGRGWSYLSVGIGQSMWSIVPEGNSPFPADEEPIRTINYGGGARWFVKKHLAFSLDVRLYEIDAGTPSFGFPGSPRTLLLVIGAGISAK
jgi:hypothetical protein